MNYKFVCHTNNNRALACFDTLEHARESWKISYGRLFDAAPEFQPVDCCTEWFIYPTGVVGYITKTDYYDHPEHL